MNCADTTKLLIDIKTKRKEFEENIGVDNERAISVREELMKLVEIAKGIDSYVEKAGRKFRKREYKALMTMFGTSDQVMEWNLRSGILIKTNDLSRVTSIKCNGGVTTVKDLDCLENIPQLEELSVYGTHYPYSEKIAELKNLKKLGLSNAVQYGKGKGLTMDFNLLKDLPLEELSAYYDPGVDLGALLDFKNLKKIQLDFAEGFFGPNRELKDPKLKEILHQLENKGVEVIVGLRRVNL